MLVHRAEDAAAAVEALVGDARTHIQVADGEARIRRVAAEAERPVGAAEVAGACEFIWLVGHADVGRQVVPRAELMADDRAEGRKLDGRRRTIAGEHVVRAAFVRCFAVRHRADDGELVGDLRGLLEVLRELHAGDRRVHCSERAAIFDRCKVLRIPRFLMGAAAGQVDVDERLGGRRKCVGLVGAELEEVAHRQPDATGEAGIEKLTTAYFAEMRRVVVPSYGFGVAHSVVVFRSCLKGSRNPMQGRIGNPTAEPSLVKRPEFFTRGERCNLCRRSPRKLG